MRRRREGEKSILWRDAKVLFLVSGESFLRSRSRWLFTFFFHEKAKRDRFHCFRGGWLGESIKLVSRRLKIESADASEFTDLRNKCAVGWIRRTENAATTKYRRRRKALGGFHVLLSRSDMPDDENVRLLLFKEKNDEFASNLPFRPTHISDDSSGLDSHSRPLDSAAIFQNPGFRLFLLSSSMITSIYQSSLCGDFALLSSPSARRN